jgi:hypothetical protein
LEKFIIFDNGGVTPDRFTVINKETGDVFGVSEDPDGPNGIGKLVGNCAGHRIVLYGSGWRQKLPTKKILREEINNYVNNAKLDPHWIGTEMDVTTLPENVRRYLSRIDCYSPVTGQPTANIVYMPRNLSEMNNTATK